MRGRSDLRRETSRRTKAGPSIRHAARRCSYTPLTEAGLPGRRGLSTDGSTTRRCARLANLRAAHHGGESPCSPLDALLLQSPTGTANGRDAPAPAGRPEGKRDRASCRSTQEAAGYAERTNCGSPGGRDTRPTRLLQPWHFSDAVTRRRAIAFTRLKSGRWRCGTGPLARYRFAPRRRGITFGRRSARTPDAVATVEALVRSDYRRHPNQPRCGCVRRLVGHASRGHGHAVTVLPCDQQRYRL